jgi:tRNA U54 and U55 pseudouridine synthase Pus10
MSVQHCLGALFSQVNKTLNPSEKGKMMGIDEELQKQSDKNTTVHNSLSLT